MRQTLSPTIAPVSLTVRRRHPTVAAKVPFERSRPTMKMRRFDTPLDDRFDGRIDDLKPVMERIQAADRELA